MSQRYQIKLTHLSDVSQIVHSRLNNESSAAGSATLILWIVSESCASEKLEGEKLNVAEVTQSEIAQKQKLQTVLERINDSLKLSTRNIRWNVDCKGSSSLLGSSTICKKKSAFMEVLSRGLR